MTTDIKNRDSAASLMPSTREHGVWGTKSDAVGGFGEGYSAQVAHGSEPNLADAEEEAPAAAPMSMLQTCASPCARGTSRCSVQCGTSWKKRKLKRAREPFPASRT